MATVIYKPLEKEIDNIINLLVASGYKKEYFDKGYIKIVEVDPGDYEEDDTKIKLVLTGKAFSVYGYETKTHELTKLSRAIYGLDNIMFFVNLNIGEPELTNTLADFFKSTYAGVLFREDEMVNVEQIGGWKDRYIGEIVFDLKLGPDKGVPSATRKKTIGSIERRVQCIDDTNKGNTILLCPFNNVNNLLKSDSELTSVQVEPNKYVFYMDGYTPNETPMEVRIIRLRIRKWYNKQVLEEDDLRRSHGYLKIETQLSKEPSRTSEITLNNVMFNIDKTSLSPELAYAPGMTDFVFSFYSSNYHAIVIEVTRLDRAWARIFQPELSVVTIGTEPVKNTLTDSDSKRFPFPINVTNTKGIKTEIVTKFDTMLKLEENPDDVIVTKIRSFIKELLKSNIVTCEEPTVTFKEYIGGYRIFTVVLSDMVSKGILVMDSSKKPEIEFHVKNDVSVLPYKINGFKQVK